MAKSRHSVEPVCSPAVLARIARMRAAARSASCSSWSHSMTLTGSPWPNSLQSFFWKILGLSAMTLFAAVRIAPVER